ncbi:hypothetical protein Tco_0689359 [Tanacetum coccineum]
MLHPNRLILPCRKAHLLENKQIPSVGVFDEVIWEAFGGKARDLGSIWEETGQEGNLQDFDGALDYSAWRRRHKSPLTPSKLEGYEVTIICDDVIIICDDVTIANLKKPIEDSAG